MWRRGRGGGGAPAQLGPSGRGAGLGGQLRLPGPGGSPREGVLLKLKQKQSSKKPEDLTQALAHITRYKAL